MPAVQISTSSDASQKLPKLSRLLHQARAGSAMNRAFEPQNSCEESLCSRLPVWFVRVLAIQNASRQQSLASECCFCSCVSADVQSFNEGAPYHLPAHLEVWAKKSRRSLFLGGSLPTAGFERREWLAHTTKPRPDCSKRLLNLSSRTKF